jgi:hypothetical protein
MKIRLVRGANLFIFSTLYAFWTLFPFKNWIRWSNYLAEPLPKIHYSDSIYYIGQLREILNGNLNIGNPIVLEHSKDGFSYGNSSLYFIWGTIGRIIHLNTMQTYLVMIYVSSVVLFLVIFWLYSNFYSFNVSLVLSLIVSLFFIGPLGRPSPTQQLLPMLILGINCYLFILKVNYKKSPTIILSLTYFLILVVLATGNPIYSLYLLILVCLLKLCLKQANNLLLFLTIGVNTLYLFWNKLSMNQLDELVGLRFGVHSTRIPGALRITVPCIMVLILVSTILFKNTRGTLELSNASRVKILTFFALNLSLLLSVNSQIITNQAYEMESHFILIWDVTLLLFLYEAINFILHKLRVPRIKLNLDYPVLILSIILFTLLITKFPEVTTKNSDEATLLKSISENSKIEVVAVTDQSRFIGLNEKIIYLTDAYLYWDPYSVASQTFQKEILSRYACSQNHTDSLAEYIAMEPELYFHQFANSRQKKEKVNKVLDYFGIKTFSYTNEKILNSDYQVYLSEREICRAGTFKYRVDMIVD